MALRGGPSYAYLCDQLETVAETHQWIEPMTSATGWSAGSYDESFGFGALHIAATDTGATPTKTYGADFTLRRYTHIRVWIDDVSKLGTLTFRTFDASDNQIGAQNILTGAQKVAVTGWNDLVVVRSSFPTNHRKIRFNVTATAGNTVNVYIGAIQTCDLRALCTIWTDDAHGSVFTEAYPLMAARGMSGVVSVPSSLIGSAGLMTTANLQTLDAAGWDICSHADTNVDLTTLTEAQVRSEVNTCLAFLRDTVGIKAARHLFVHPMGDANANTREWVADYAWMDRSRTSDNSRIPVEWISIGGDDIQNTTPVATVQGLIDDAVTGQEWLVLIFHRFTDGTPGALEYNTTDFDDILAYLQSADIDVVTATGAVAAMAPNYALTGDDTVAVLDRATAYWKGVDYSGSGDWLDGSGNGHDATPRNSPTFNSSGGYWTLNGSNQDFEVSHHADFDVGTTTDFTILAVALTDSRSTQCMVSKRLNGVTANRGYLLYDDADEIRLEVSDGTVEQNPAHTADYDLNPELFNVKTAWAGARDTGADQYKVAREGTYATTVPDNTTSNLSNSESLYIGSWGGNTYWFNGRIYAVAIWIGEALSEADLATAATELDTPAPSSGISTPSGVAGNYGINIAVRVGI